MKYLRHILALVAGLVCMGFGIIQLLLYISSITNLHVIEQSTNALIYMHPETNIVFLTILLSSVFVGIFIVTFTVSLIRKGDNKIRPKSVLLSLLFALVGTGLLAAGCYTYSITNYKAPADLQQDWVNNTLQMNYNIPSALGKNGFEKSSYLVIEGKNGYYALTTKRDGEQVTIRVVVSKN